MESVLVNYIDYQPVSRSKMEFTGYTPKLLPAAHFAQVTTFACCRLNEQLPARQNEQHRAGLILQPL